MNEAELAQRLNNYKFYHTIPLTENLSTPGAPEHAKSQEPVKAAIESIPFEGKRVLDVGCRDGMYSFMAEKRGAKDIIGIDHNISEGAVELVIPFLNSKVTMHEMNMFELTPKSFGMFDVVIFAGVLYHLRYPFWALKLLRDVTNPGGIMVLETAIFYSEDPNPMMYCPVGNDSPYEPTSCTFYNRRGLADTLESLGWRVLGSSVLHPDAEGRRDDNGNLVIDRAVFVCQYVPEVLDSIVNNYWDGLHDLHSKFGGDTKSVQSSGVLSGKV